MVRHHIVVARFSGVVDVIVASIFKRMSETPGAQNSVTDYTGAYKV